MCGLFCYLFLMWSVGDQEVTFTSVAMQQKSKYFQVRTPRVRLQETKLEEVKNAYYIFATSAAEKWY